MTVLLVHYKQYSTGCVIWGTFPYLGIFLPIKLFKSSPNKISRSRRSRYSLINFQHEFWRESSRSWTLDQHVNWSRAKHNVIFGSYCLSFIMAKSTRKSIEFQQKWVVRYGICVSARDSVNGEVCSAECRFCGDFAWLAEMIVSTLAKNASKQHT